MNNGLDLCTKGGAVCVGTPHQPFRQRECFIFMRSLAERYRFLTFLQETFEFSRKLNEMVSSVKGKRCQTKQRYVGWQEGEMMEEECDCEKRSDSFIPFPAPALSQKSLEHGAPLGKPL